MWPHVEADLIEQDDRDVTAVAKIFRSSRHHQMFRLGLHEGGKHRTNAAEVQVGHSNSHENGGKEKEQILEHADPRYPAHAAYIDKRRNQCESYDHRGSAM